MSYATVTILSAADSTSIADLVTDSSGTATVQLQQDSFYIVKLSSVNFQPLVKNIAVKGEAPVYTMVLTPLAGTLNQVIVRANKPLMRQEDDKTIIDPENLALVSTNAYETIEKTPGLFIDPDGNIYISSTTPATVYINGREQKMSAADVAS